MNMIDPSAKRFFITIGAVLLLIISISLIFVVHAQSQTSDDVPQSENYRMPEYSITIQ